MYRAISLKISLGRGTYLYGCIGTISNSYFRNNRGYLVQTYGSINLENNIFENNLCSTEQCLWYGVYSWNSGWETGNITRNQFEDNSGTHIIEYSSINGHAHITDNTFNGNQLLNSLVQALIKVISIYVLVYLMTLLILGEWPVDFGIQFHNKSQD
jgi:hypothetical protein